VPAVLALPQTEVPNLFATFDKTLPTGKTVHVSGFPVAGGNFLGTLNGTTPLTASYCVNINQELHLTTYRQASVSYDGKTYSAAVPNAGAISWLLTQFGQTAKTPEEQDALQAAIWRAEYGAGFQLDGVDNDNNLYPINATIAPLYRNYLAALGNHTAPVDSVTWISPGANPDYYATRGQGLAALEVTPDVAVSRLAWVPVRPGIDTASKVSFQIDSQGYAGQVRLTLYQSSDGVKGDAVLASTLATVRADSATPGQMAITRAPVHGPNPFAANVPNFLILEVQPVAPVHEANKANNVTTLQVAEPQPLSVELEGAAPLANTRAERVALWLAGNSVSIRLAATRFRVPASAIAGTIAWEALFNVATIRTYQGPGKVHPISNQLGLPSAAEQVEQLGLMPKVNLLARQRLVQIPYSAIQYIGAILDSYALAAERAGSTANIRNNPGVLVTFYNGVAKEAPRSAVTPYYETALFSGKTWILPLNATSWFRYSINVLHNDTYSPDPNPTSMGSWVQANVGWLGQAVGMP
jgi:hypothetical protein